MSTRVLLLLLFSVFSPPACTSPNNYTRTQSAPSIPLGSIEQWVCVKKADFTKQLNVYAKSAEAAESMLEGYSCTLVPLP